MEGEDRPNELRDLICELRRLVDAVAALAATDGLTREAYAIKELRRVVPFGPAATYVLLQQKLLKAKVLNLSDDNERSGRTMILREDLLAFLRSLPDYLPLNERVRNKPLTPTRSDDCNSSEMKVVTRNPRRRKRGNEGGQHAGPFGAEGIAHVGQRGPAS